jgi:hypothetical protein
MLSDPASRLRQAAGPIHVHPHGRFVYLTSRAWWLTDFEGKQVFAGGENSQLRHRRNRAEAAVLGGMVTLS